jgi:hypothetical protein
VAHACFDDGYRSASFLLLCSGGERETTCIYVTMIGVQRAWLLLRLCP